MIDRLVEPQRLEAATLAYAIELAHLSQYTIRGAKLAVAERDLASGRVEAYNRRHLRPAIIFDCDGVLNEEPRGNGVVHCDDVRLLPGAGAAVTAARCLHRVKER